MVKDTYLGLVDEERGLNEYQIKLEEDTISENIFEDCVNRLFGKKLLYSYDVHTEVYSIKDVKGNIVFETFLSRDYTGGNDFVRVFNNLRMIKKHKSIIYKIMSFLKMDTNDLFNENKISYGKTYVGNGKNIQILDGSVGGV